MRKKEYKNYETRVSALIDSDEYGKISSHLNYGQLTTLMRKFFGSLNLIVSKKGFNDISLYLNNGKDLLLPRNKD